MSETFYLVLCWTWKQPPHTKNINKKKIQKKEKKTKIRKSTQTRHYDSRLYFITFFNNYLQMFFLLIHALIISSRGVLNYRRTFVYTCFETVFLTFSASIYFQTSDLCKNFMTCCVISSFMFCLRLDSPWQADRIALVSPKSQFARTQYSSMVKWITEREMNMFCIILFHNTHIVVFFARLANRKNLAHPSLNFESGRTDF